MTFARQTQQFMSKTSVEFGGDPSRGYWKKSRFYHNISWFQRVSIGTTNKVFLSFITPLNQQYARPLRNRDESVTHLVDFPFYTDKLGENNAKCLLIRKALVPERESPTDNNILVVG